MDLEKIRQSIEQSQAIVDQMHKDNKDNRYSTWLPMMTTLVAAVMFLFVLANFYFH